MANETVVALRDGLDKLRTLKKAHSAICLVGEIIVLNGQVIVAVNASAADVANAFVYRGKVEAAKEAALALDVGDVAYWDAVNGVITTTASGNTKMGMVVEDAEAADDNGVVMLDENK